MAETTTISPQILPAASDFSIYNSVFIASNSPPRLISPNHSIARPPSLPSLPSVEAESLRERTESLVESEAYARLLLPRRRGYPLWKPKPDERLPVEYRRNGVRIGDIGILNEFGGFDYLFNVCLPEDHPVNVGRVPTDFRPLQGIDEDDTVGSSREYEPGAHVPSDSANIHKTRIPVPQGQARIKGVPKQVGAGLSFSSTTTKGALLILPEGGMRIDHQKYTRFYRYAAECARSWYSYVNGPLERGAHNGSIYLVTGCDKARAWGVASFSNSRPEHVSLEFVPSEPDNEGDPPEYWFSKCSSASSSSEADDVFKKQSGCVFLRGFKIAIRPPVLTRSSTKVTYIPHLDADELVPRPRSSSFSIPTESQWWPVSFLGPRIANFTSSPLEHYFWDDRETDLVKHRVYHPSDVINDWILDKNNEVEVAITHDDDWASVVEDTELDMPQNEELIRRIDKKYEVLVSGGYARINRQCDSPDLRMPDVSLHALRRSHSDPSLVRTFQSEPHKKIIRRYASASSNLFNRSQTYSILGFLSPSLSSVDDDSEVPRVVVWPPSPASRAPSAGPSDNSPTSHRACVHEDSGTRQTIDSPVSDMSYNSPPFSPQSSSASAWETSSNSNSTSDFSRPNSPNFSPPRKFEVLLDFGRKNDSSGFYTPEYPHYWEGPPKQHERRKSTGDTLIPPLRTKHQDDYPRSPTPSSPPPFRLQTPTHSNSDGKS